jgi:hypothetical protein
LRAGGADISLESVKTLQALQARESLDTIDAGRTRDAI